MLKVGFELFWAHGPEAVRASRLSRPVFVDCKLHDIPTTVERARREHRAARGRDAQRPRARRRGDDARRASTARARRRRRRVIPLPLVIAVTVLSSPRRRGPRVARRRWRSRRTRRASTASSCRATTSSEVREVCGEEFCLVVPGIRPAGANGHDQVRVLTPEAAIDAAPTTSSSVGRSRAPTIRSVSRARSARPSADDVVRCETRRSRRLTAVCALSGPCVYSPGSPAFHRSEGERSWPFRRLPRNSAPTPREGCGRAQEARRAEGRAEVRQAARSPTC